MELPPFLTRKIGPLPVIAWIGVLAGIVLAYEIYDRRKTAASDTTTVPDTDATTSDTADTTDDDSSDEGDIGDSDLSEDELSAGVDDIPGPEGPAGPAGPAGKDASTTPAVKANPIKVTPKPAAKPTAVAKVKATSPATKSPVKETTHKVVAGDTLSGIAAKYHTTLAEIERLNPQIHNPNVIDVGESVNVPG